jgi:hypothetical protein
MLRANSDRVVCSDSYFAFVTKALEMNKIGLQFIGVVDKTISYGLSTRLGVAT